MNEHVPEALKLMLKFPANGPVVGMPKNANSDRSFVSRNAPIVTLKTPLVPITVADPKFPVSRVVPVGMSPAPMPPPLRSTPPTILIEPPEPQFHPPEFAPVVKLSEQDTQVTVVPLLSGVPPIPVMVATVMFDPTRGLAPPA